ncbi:unnamed protein product [Allacma fusca]|uniref:Uncharacterized protein n=1 Tax=Allacma fusca TaxID=39272 RepID=A0A8J2J091_9HEXA|nr:unnamed protein product [Allacma fusca]
MGGRVVEATFTTGFGLPKKAFKSNGAPSERTIPFKPLCTGNRVDQWYLSGKKIAATLFLTKDLALQVLKK